MKLHIDERMNLCKSGLKKNPVYASFIKVGIFQKNKWQEIFSLNGARILDRKNGKKFKMLTVVLVWSSPISPSDLFCGGN